MISGDGIGAGKTTLARSLGDQVWSLAGALRDELALLYPNYDWHNRTQAYKEKTIVKEADYRSVRQVLIEHGQAQCERDPVHYVRQIVDKLKGVSRIASGTSRVAVDDLRKVIELEYFREHLPNVVHYHIVNPDAIPEKHFQNEELKLRADYLIQWSKKAV